MKTICFFNSLKVWGGGEKFYFDYALGFHQKGHKVIVACDKDSVLAEKAKAHGLTQFHVSVRMLSALNPFKVFRLVQFFKKEGVDTVLFSTSQDSKIAGLSAKLAGVPSIAYRRGLAVPIKNRLTNRFLFKNILTHIIANSEETKRGILQNLKGSVSPEQIRVIYNGLHFDENTQASIQPHPEVVKRGKGLILGNAGRLTAQKGQKYLIEIAKMLKSEGQEFTIFIAGIGDMHAELEEMIRANGLEEQIILLGFVEDINGFMQSLDIFLLTSLWEGFGYVLAEAMLAAKPVVAFRISSNPEIVLENETGYLITHPDLKDFAQKTLSLMKSPEIRVKLGEAGRQSVYDRFRISDRVDEVESYLFG